MGKLVMGELAGCRSTPAAARRARMPASSAAESASERRALL